MRATTFFLLLACIAAACADGCDYLEEMGNNGDLGAIQSVLEKADVLPPETQDNATLLLPTTSAFVSWVIGAGFTPDSIVEQLDTDPVMKAKIDSVLMTHYLVGNGLTVDYLGENSPFPTALSLMWNNSAYDITVDAKAKTIKTAQTTASIIDTVKLCGLTGYVINAVLMPTAFDNLPQTTHDMIFGLFNMTDIFF